MYYSEAKKGRCFIIRLEDGDIIHEEIEKFSRENSIKAAVLNILGGVDKNSRIVSGPKYGRAENIEPIIKSLKGVHEITGTGTIFPDENGEPKLHMHISCGRGNNTLTGCIRPGVKTWHVLEIVLTELLNIDSKRIKESETGFELLQP